MTICNIMFGKDKESKNIVDLAQEFEEGKTEASPTAPPSPANSTVPQVSEIKDAVASLLENVKNVDSYVEFNLPSLGKMYSDYDSDTVKVRALKFSDEKRIQSGSQGDRALNALNNVLADCIQGPAYKDLTVPDKLFCLYKIRELSYGSKYEYAVDCDSCSHETSLGYQLSSMKVDYLEGDIESETTVILPDSKKTARVSALRVVDEPNIQSIKQVIESLPDYILEVEGITDKTIISLFLEGTTVRDVAALRKVIFSPSYGLNTDTDWICDKCGAENSQSIGINSNFFFTS